MQIKGGGASTNYVIRILRGGGGQTESIYARGEAPPEMNPADVSISSAQTRLCDWNLATNIVPSNSCDIRERNL